jgi:hypothetical protein
MLIVKAMEDVMHNPAIRAGTRPDKANKVVIKTPTAPRASKRRSSQRFVIQKVYHIYE